MSARGSNRIWWVPQHLPVTRAFPDLIHWCRFAVVGNLTHRECLDPMALGVCRFCREPLPPVPSQPTKEKES